VVCVGIFNNYDTCCQLFVDDNFDLHMGGPWPQQVHMASQNQQNIVTFRCEVKLTQCPRGEQKNINIIVCAHYFIVFGVYLVIM